MKNQFDNCADNKHEHCYHAFRGMIHMVVKDGHVVQQCCQCNAMRTIHADHAHDDTSPKRCDGNVWRSRSWTGGKVEPGDEPKWIMRCTD